MTTNPAQPIEILLVEDDKFHQVMAKKFLDKSEVKYTLHIAADGQEALNFVFRRENHSDAPRPDLILLDLGLPKVDGQDVYDEIRKDADLQKIPLVVLTGADSDVLPAKFADIPSNLRFTKWMGMKEFNALIRTVQDYRTSFAKKAA